MGKKRPFGNFMDHIPSMTAAVFLPRGENEEHLNPFPASKYIALEERIRKYILFPEGLPLPVLPVPEFTLKENMESLLYR